MVSSGVRLVPLAPYRVQCSSHPPSSAHRAISLALTPATIPERKPSAPSDERHILPQLKCPSMQMHPQRGPQRGPRTWTRISGRLGGSFSSLMGTAGGAGSNSPRPYLSHRNQPVASPGGAGRNQRSAASSERHSRHLGTVERRVAGLLLWLQRRSLRKAHSPRGAGSSWRRLRRISGTRRGRTPRRARRRLEASK